MRPWEGFLAGSYAFDAKIISAARAINLYPKRMEAPGGKQGFSFHSVPGIRLFADLSTYTYGSKLHVESADDPDDDRLFCIAGTDLLEIDSSAVVTDRGDITAGSINSMASSGDELLVTGNGAEIKSFDLGTPSLSAAISNTPTKAGKLSWVDGYFIAFDVSTQRWYISAAGDGTSWNTLDFTSAESHPDNIVDQLVDHREIWLAGRKSLEVYRNTGAASFAFEPVGSVIAYGVLPGSLVSHDNGIHFIGSSGGHLSVYRAEGYQPFRISTHAIEELLAAIVGPVSSNCYSWTHKGHAFYTISTVTPTSGSGLVTSLTYDSSTGQWHEHAHWTSAETFTNLGIKDYAYAFGKHLVVIEDANFKGIYELTDAVQTDVLAPAGNADDEIKVMRVAPHVSNSLMQGFFRSVQLDGSGFNAPKLSWSDNNGASYTSEFAAANDRTRWDALGSGDDRLFKFTDVLDSSPLAISGAYIDVTSGPK